MWATGSIFKLGDGGLALSSNAGEVGDARERIKAEYSLFAANLPRGGLAPISLLHEKSGACPKSTRAEVRLNG